MDSPGSCYHGLAAAVVTIDQIGAFLTFSPAECAKIPDDPPGHRRVTPNRPIPFNHGSFVKPGQPIRPAWQPPPTEPDGPLPIEICGCLTFGGKPCNNCRHCHQCNLRIRGAYCDTHAMRHYVHTEEYRDIKALNERNQKVALGIAVTVPEVTEPQEEPVAKPIGQVSLWD